MALKAVGISAAAFHGSVKNATKDDNLKLWLSGDILVMCATVAFGMGVDKADVRFGACMSAHTRHCDSVLQVFWPH